MQIARLLGGGVFSFPFHMELERKGFYCCRIWGSSETGMIFYFLVFQVSRTTIKAIMDHLQTASESLEIEGGGRKTAVNGANGF